MLALSDASAQGFRMGVPHVEPHWLFKPNAHPSNTTTSKLNSPKMACTRGCFHSEQCNGHSHTIAPPPLFTSRATGSHTSSMERNSLRRALRFAGPPGRRSLTPHHGHPAVQGTEVHSKAPRNARASSSAFLRPSGVVRSQRSRCNRSTLHLFRTWPMLLWRSHANSITIGCSSHV